MQEKKRGGGMGNRWGIPSSLDFVPNKGEIKGYPHPSAGEAERLRKRIWRLIIRPTRRLTATRRRGREGIYE